MSSGAPLNLTLEPSGTKGWATAMNANLSAINTAIAALQAGGTTGATGATGPAGPVGMVFAGNWQSTTNYAVTNVVAYNGSCYIAIAANISRPPDTNTNTWTLIASVGATGPAGPTGPTGPAGQSGGQTVAFPITVPEGGTGGTTPASGRAGLLAAASGVNSDITQLVGLTAPPSLGAFGNGAINIQSTGGDGQALLFTDNNGHSGGFTTQGDAYFSSLSMSGGLLCGAVQAAGGVITNTISNASPGSPVEILPELFANAGLVVQGSAPTTVTGQVAFGGTIASTASPGGGATVPATVLGFLLINYNGNVIGKLAIFAN